MARNKPRMLNFTVLLEYPHDMTDGNTEFFWDWVAEATKIRLKSPNFNSR